MDASHQAEHGESSVAAGRIFAAIELSKSAWVIAIRLPTTDKVSLFRIAGGDIQRLYALFDRACDRVGHEVQICTCYEAGFDGFWIHRALAARGIRNLILDSSSIQVSRRGRRVKADRTDAEGLIRVLMAYHRGEHDVARIVQVPSPQEEDAKRLLRSRSNLLRERIRHANRIGGLLHLQGVRDIDPNRQNWAAALTKLRTAHGGAFPPQLMREIRREAKLLATVQAMLAEVEAEIAGMVRDVNKRRHPAQRGRSHPIATRLTRIRGVGQQSATLLATEVFYRRFNNRGEVVSYMGLTPTPYNSGSMERDQGISKAGNRRAPHRIGMDLVAQSAGQQTVPLVPLSVGTASGRLRRITIVALARKLMVALWRLIEAGVVPQGAVVR